MQINYFEIFFWKLLNKKSNFKKFNEVCIEKEIYTNCEKVRERWTLKRYKNKKGIRNKERKRKKENECRRMRGKKKRITHCEREGGERKRERVGL